MHEVFLIESVVGLVENKRRKQNFSRVRMIRLKVGALGHAEPEALRFCFDAVAHGTIADGARNLVSFHLGIDDARILAPWFEPTFRYQDLLYLPNYMAVARLLVGGQAVQPLDFRTQPPPHAEQSSMTVASVC